MANRCYTYVTVDCGTEKLADKVEDFLNNVLDSVNDNIKSDKDYYDARKNWIGNLAVQLGASVEDIRKGNISVRGSVDDVYRTTDTDIELVLDCAWQPQLGFVPYLKKKFPKVECNYYCEEPGNGVYFTDNDEGEDTLKVNIIEDYLYNIEDDLKSEDIDPSKLLFYKSKTPLSEYINDIKYIDMQEWY